MTNTNPGDPSNRPNYSDPAARPTNPPGENHVVHPNPQSYSSGYNQGRVVERQRYETTQQARDENNTANGFLIGLLLTALVLGGAALAYFATQRDRTPAPQRTIIVPSASPSPSPSPEVKERVIERDRVVPVPQPQQSAPTVIPAPTIKVEPPAASPAPQESPAPSTKQQEEPTRTEQPRSAEPSPSPSPSPEATASPNSSSSGQ